MNARSPDEVARRLLTEAVIPRQNGEPVFTAPWQAQVFALAGILAATGVYDWERFEPLLGTEEQPADLEQWLLFLESALESRGLVQSYELSRRMHDLTAASEHSH